MLFILQRNYTVRSYNWYGNERIYSNKDNNKLNWRYWINYFMWKIWRFSRWWYYNRRSTGLAWKDRLVSRDI